MGATPHAFQVVVTTFIFLEEMDDSIAVIHQHPTAFGCALNRGRQLAVLFFDLLAHIISQRAQLTITVAGADDEVIRDDSIRAQVEQDDVFSLFIFY